MFLKVFKLLVRLIITHLSAEDIVNLIFQAIREKNKAIEKLQGLVDSAEKEKAELQSQLDEERR